MSTEDHDSGAPVGGADDRSLPFADILQGLVGAATGSQGQDIVPTLLGQLLGGGAGSPAHDEVSGFDLDDLLDRIAAGDEPHDAALRAATGIPQVLGQKADVEQSKVLIILRELLRLLATARRPAKKRRRRPQSSKPKPSSNTAAASHAKPKPKPKPKPAVKPKPKPAAKPKPKPGSKPKRLE